MRLTPGELTDRKTVAQRLFSMPEGREFFGYLLDDLGYFDIPETEAEMVLHNFGLLFIKRYFGVTDDRDDVIRNRDHRSLVTEAILRIGEKDG